jgi:hypothetical protein
MTRWLPLLAAVAFGVAALILLVKIALKVGAL